MKNPPLSWFSLRSYPRSGAANSDQGQMGGAMNALSAAPAVNAEEKAESEWSALSTTRVYGNYARLMRFRDDDEFQEDEEVLHFGTVNEAIAACRKSVDEVLQERYSPKIKGADLYRKYLRVAPDLYVDAAVGEPIYIACNYARKRCLQMCIRW